VGLRYHKRGQNFDLCQKDYEDFKEDGVDPSLFDRYASAQTLHDWNDDHKTTVPETKNSSSPNGALCFSRSFVLSVCLMRQLLIVSTR